MVVSIVSKHYVLFRTGRCCCVLVSVAGLDEGRYLLDLRRILAGDACDGVLRGNSAFYHPSLSHPAG